jgi:hypothetical protein
MSKAIIKHFNIIKIKIYNKDINILSKLLELSDINGAINIMRKKIELKEITGKKILNP